MAGKRQRLAERRKTCGYSQESFADAVKVDRATVQRWERGAAEPQPCVRRKIMRVLQITSKELDELLSPELSPPLLHTHWMRNSVDYEDETEAWELARRVQSSDVGNETLERLECAFDDLATAYPKSSPQELLQRVRTHSAYVGHLLDGKMTLSEHRRLLVVGGWLSLLGATLNIDLKQERAATARLQTAATFAHQAEHAEIQAWCFETEAWHVLNNGDYERAVQLSQIAQQIAPTGSSVLIQATAQEGRAHARLGQSKETYKAIDRVQRLSNALELAVHPEHHYRYDPAKTLSYSATTLAWVGDPAAEEQARQVIARLSPSNDVTKWPRRVASANLDLALSLLTSNRLDEACDAAQRAILSGRVVPSNHWRALEVVKVAESRHLPEAVDLWDAYRALEAKES
jgi:transcriptional regulator with XRE-family HTH domain